MGGRVVADLLIKIGADNSDAKAKLGQTDSLIGASVAKARAAGVAMTAALTVPIVAFAASSYKAASNVNESMNAVNTTFGNSSQQIIDWSLKSADAMGISQAAYLQSAAVVGVYGKAAGLAGADLNKFSNDVVSATADMASFYNTSTDEAQMAFQAGLRGEFDPLEQYGVLLNAATVQQKALDMGLGDTTGAVSQQNLVLARQALILEQLGANGVLGDFVKTQDSGANASRRLSANLTDLRASIGQVLVPVVDRAIGTLNRWVRALTALPKGAKEVVVVVALMVAALGPLLVLLTTIGPVLGMLAAGFLILISPITLVAAALLALGFLFRNDLVDGIAEVGDRLSEFVGDIKDVYDRLREGKDVLDATTRQYVHLESSVSVVSAVIRAFGSALEDLLGIEMSDWFYNLAQAVDAFISAVGDRDVAGMIRAAFDIGVLTVNAVVNIIVSIGELLWGGITELTGDIWGWVKEQVLASRGPVGDQTGGPQPYGGAGSVNLGDVLAFVGSLVWGGIKNVAGSVWDWAINKIKGLGGGGGGDAAATASRQLLGEGGGGVSDREVLLGAFTATVTAVWGGITNVAGNIWGWIKEQITVGGGDAATTASQQLLGGGGGGGGNGINLGAWTLSVDAPTIEGVEDVVSTAVQNAVTNVGAVTSEVSEWIILLTGTPDVQTGDGGATNTVWFQGLLTAQDFGAGFIASIPGVNVLVLDWTFVGPGLGAANDKLQEAITNYRQWRADLPSWTLWIPGPLMMFAFQVSFIYDKLRDYTGIPNVSLDEWVLNVKEPGIDLAFDLAQLAAWVGAALLGLGAVNIDLPNPLNLKVSLPKTSDPSEDQARAYRHVTDATGAGGELTPVEKVSPPDFTAFHTSIDTAVGQAIDKFDSIRLSLNNPFTATFDADTGPAAVAYTNVMTWGGIYAGSTFTGTFAGDTGPAAVAYTDVMGWGAIWQASVHTATFAINHGPAAVAYTEAFGWGDIWGRTVFTASFSADVSGLYEAVRVAQWAAGEIAAILPHSPAKKGPLRELPSFAYIGEIAARDLAGLGGIIADAMDPGDLALPRFGGGGGAGRPLGVRDADAVGVGSGRGYVEQHNTYRIERATFGNGTDWNRFFDGKNREAAVSAWDQ